MSASPMGGVLNFFGRLFGHHYGDADTDAVDSSGDTPLLMAVKKQSVDAALALLLDGANPDTANPTSLDTPLHIAAQLANITLVRLLLVFKANPTLKNTKGRNAFEEVGSNAKNQDQKESCLKALEDVTKLLEQRKSTFEADQLPEAVDSDSVFLLALDGGGIRGLVMSHILEAIEERMAQLSPNPPHISTFFDWIAGTSTGSFMALALSHLKISATGCRKFYFTFKSKALDGRRVYPAEGIEGSLKDAFGTEAVMADIKGPKVCVTTCLADRAPPELHLFTNYGTPRNGQPGPAEKKVWEAARASSAAPTYFPPFDKKFLDGGVMANNPTLDTMVEICNEKPGVKIGCVLSLGTGVMPVEYISDGVSVVNPYSPSALFEDYQALKDLADIFIDRITITNGQELERAETWCKSIGTPYFRLSAPLDATIELDEKDNPTLIKMLFNTQLYIYKESTAIDKVARMLLAKGKLA